MVLLRWIAILWLLICLGCIPFASFGWPSTVLLLAIVALVFFICWTFGSFARSDPNSRKAHHDHD